MLPGYVSVPFSADVMIAKVDHTSGALATRFELLNLFRGPNLWKIFLGIKERVSERAKKRSRVAD